MHSANTGYAGGINRGVREAMAAETVLVLNPDVRLLTFYEPQSVAVHIGGASGRGDRTHAMQIVNRVRLHRRRHGPLASWCYLWLTAASELSWLARGHRVSAAAIAALLRPSRRPPEIGCGTGLMPR